MSLNQYFHATNVVYINGNLRRKLLAIIVRFKSHKKKTKLYKARKHLKSVSLNQHFHSTNVVYISGNLRRKLLAKVRKFKKDNHWHSAWTLDGKISIKKFTLRKNSQKWYMSKEILPKLANFAFFFIRFFRLGY